MATTLALRRRIKTARNISKTTRALQMIAASRLKRAQNAAVSARPYVTKLVAVAQSLAPKGSSQGDELHPYMQLRKSSGRTLYILISPDRGLCGALNTNLAREYFKFKNENNSVFLTVGKKIESFVSATNKNLLAAFPFGNTLPSFAAVAPLTKIIDEQYLGGKVDKVKILSTKFTSVFSQAPVVTDLLPVRLEITKDEKKESDSRMFEPSQEELLPALLKRYIEMVIFQQLLENYASFNAAQMIAMQNATNNAKDVVNALTLLYNKARQEKITKEILDITSGAVAMEQTEG
jgi:F-type H+-transporting ATPase subunit gamma